MTVHELMEEWYGLTLERKKQAISNLVSALIDEDEMDPGIRELLIHASFLEQDDYFGTEGARL